MYQNIIKINIDGQFFFRFFMQQNFFIALICVFGGSGLIANDLKNNALQLYLSKPLTRMDYIIGKFAIVLILMSFITTVPGILLFIENSLLTNGLSFLKDKYWMLGSIIIYSLIITLPTAFLILALSSATKNSRYAALGFVAIIIGSPIFSGMLRQILKIKSANYISYWINIYTLGRLLFGLKGDESWYWALPLVVAIILVCAWVLHRNIRGVEIVK
jgi:ABC-type transport system involved in multi-copper enzyme maturation permease subunit